MIVDKAALLVSVLATWHPAMLSYCACDKLIITESRTYTVHVHGAGYIPDHLWMHNLGIAEVYLTSHLQCGAMHPALILVWPHRLGGSEGQSVQPQPCHLVSHNFANDTAQQRCACKLFGQCCPDNYQPLSYVMAYGH